MLFAQFSLVAPPTDTLAAKLHYMLGGGIKNRYHTPSFPKEAFLWN